MVRREKNIAYQRWGSGTRHAVAISPALGNLDLLWTDAAISDALVAAGDRGEFAIYDPLGQGLSDPIDSVPTLEERAADLAAVLDACGFESATIAALFDASLVAFMFAAMYPSRVDGLVLWNPFAQGWRSAPFPELTGWEDADEVASYDRAWDDVHLRWGRGDSLRMQMPALATRSNLRLWSMLERAAASRGVIRTLHDATFAADVRELLPLIQARVLVLRTVGHRLPEAVMRHVVELLPNARFEELPETSSMADFLAAYERHVEEFVFGVARDGTASRALTTVLFTDIVGSTERAAQLGDSRWRQVLGEHERVVRAEIGAVGGRLIKMTGDGSLSIIDGPARGIRCAERIAGGVHSLGLEIRAGLHTGECEFVRGDIAGMTVHIAARISAMAGAGEVLVSRTIRDLVTGSGIALAPLGAHELKGVPGEWELFAVGERTGPLPPPDQDRKLRPADRAALTLARRAPGVLRAASRIRPINRRSSERR